MLSVTELRPHVWHIEFERAYDVAMAFLRFQEWYESPKFRRRFFTLAEYAEWYVREYGCDPDDPDAVSGSFTYPTDWSGFNVPSECVRALLDADPKDAFRDENHHDRLMCSLLEEINRREDGARYYVIGTSVEREGILDHEIAHALHYTEPDYRREADLHIGALPFGARTLLLDHLRGMNYHADSFDDEVQAYLATGPTPDMLELLPEWDELAAPFVTLFAAWIES